MNYTEAHSGFMSIPDLSEKSIPNIQMDVNQLEYIMLQVVETDNRLSRNWMICTINIKHDTFYQVTVLVSTEVQVV